MSGDCLGTEEASVEKLAKYLAALSSYALCVGCLYLWGYWTPFNVNILEYVALADIAKAAALPVVSCVALTMVSVLASDFLVGKHFPVGGGRDTPIGVVLNHQLRWMLPVYAVGIVVLWRSGLPGKWSVIGPLIAMPCAIAAQRFGFLIDVVRDDRYRTGLIWILFMTAALTFTQAREKAMAVLLGSDFDYLLQSSDGTSLPARSAIKLRQRFIGHAGDVIFLWDPVRSSLAITKLDSNRPLLIAHYGPVSLDAPASVSSPSVQASSPSSTGAPVAPPSKGAAEISPSSGAAVAPERSASESASTPRSGIVPSPQGHSPT